MTGLRPARPDDAPLLTRMLAIAANWRPDAPPRRVEEIVADPAIGHYVAGWPRPGDVGIVAPDAGAAWWRYFTADDPGFGFVDVSTPEVTIAVVAHARGRGVGHALLGALIARARADGPDALSLSVEPDNPAVRLYGRCGFVPVGHSGGSLTMLRRTATDLKACS